MERQMGKKILVIGGAILDVLARPAGPAVFRTGSCPVQDLRMSIGGDAANEAIVLAGLGSKELETALPPGFWQPSRKAGTRASAQNSPPSAAPGQ